MSVKRLSWIEEILRRAIGSIEKGNLAMAKTRVGMALHIAKELSRRAKKYQKLDMEKKQSRRD
jgi:hypothetical protein